MQKLLLVYYGPGAKSQSREAALELKQRLSSSFAIEELDLGSQLLPLFSNETMPLYVRRNYSEETLPPEEDKLLSDMDQLRDQYMRNDVLILVFPMYNFGLPAAVKAWVDSIAQAKKTFRYTEYGAQGLGNIKKALTLIFTGSTPKDSAKDFASGHIKTVLEFIGVKDVMIDGVYGTKFLGDGLSEMSAEAIERSIDWLKT